MRKKVFEKTSKSVHKIKKYDFHTVLNPIWIFCTNVFQGEEEDEEDEDEEEEF
jgi:hypothetical protein